MLTNGLTYIETVEKYPIDQSNMHNSILTLRQWERIYLEKG